MIRWQPSFFLLNLRLNSGRQPVCSCRSLTGALSCLRGLFPSRLRTCASASGGCCPASAPFCALLASEAAFCSSRKGFRLTCLLLIQLTAFSLLPQLLFTAVISSCRSVSGSVAAVSSGIRTASCFTSAPAGMLCPGCPGILFPVSGHPVCCALTPHQNHDSLTYLFLSGLLPLSTRKSIGIFINETLEKCQE